MRGIHRRGVCWVAMVVCGFLAAVPAFALTDGGVLLPEGGETISICGHREYWPGGPVPTGISLSAHTPPLRLGVGIGPEILWVDRSCTRGASVTFSRPRQIGADECVRPATGGGCAAVLLIGGRGTGTGWITATRSGRRIAHVLLVVGALGAGHGLLDCASLHKTAWHLGQGGLLQGAVRFAGGGAAGINIGGQVSVFRSNGTLVARARAHAGRCFHHRLAAGRYELNAGATLYPRLECAPSSFTIRREYITGVDAFVGCLVP